MNHIEIAAASDPMTPMKKRIVPSPGLTVIVVHETNAVKTHIPSKNIVLLATPSNVILF